MEDIEQRLNDLKSNVAADPICHAVIQALTEAVEAGKSGNYPVGSVITDSNFKVVSRGRNSVFNPRFHSEAHAEMNAITSFENSDVAEIENSILIATVEPCLMCMARLLLSKISRVIYVQPDPAASVQGRLDLLPSDFAKLMQRMKFEQFTGNEEAVAIAQELYRRGEELWAEEYAL